MNIVTGKVDIKAILGNRMGGFLFSDIIHYKNKLIITPRRSGEIYIFDLMTKKYHEVIVCSVDELGGSLFNSICCDKEYIYLIPYNCTSLICFNMETEEVNKIELENESSECERYMCWGKAAIVDEIIYIPYKTEKCIITYNQSTKKVGRLVPGGEFVSYSHIYIIKDKLWLIPYKMDEEIKIWEIKTNKIEKCIQLEKLEADEGTSQNTAASFFATLYKKGKLYLCACGVEDNFIIDTVSYKIERWSMPYDNEKYDSNSGTYFQRVISILGENDILYFINGITGEWLYFKENELKTLEIISDFKTVTNDNLLYLLWSVENKVNSINIQNDNDIKYGNDIWNKINHYN
jgi:hypothetical protein